MAHQDLESAGLMMVVHPVAKAGPIFQAIINKGKFHGMIWPTTPTGYFFVYVWKGPSQLIVCP